ncbi:hypothetical protein F4861DRAFT_412994 [Xylaria intraflava]|nr:hypothetical protein F4861DRAFT_412994 [Xylaria intraflava]
MAEDAQGSGLIKLHDALAELVEHPEKLDLTRRRFIRSPQELLSSSCSESPISLRKQRRTWRHAQAELLAANSPPPGTSRIGPRNDFWHFDIERFGPSRNPTSGVRSELLAANNPPPGTPRIESRGIFWHVEPNRNSTSDAQSELLAANGPARLQNGNGNPLSPASCSLRVLQSGPELSPTAQKSRDNEAMSSGARPEAYASVAPVNPPNISKRKRAPAVSPSGGSSPSTPIPRRRSKRLRGAGLGEAEDTLVIASPDSPQDETPINPNRVIAARPKTVGLAKPNGMSKKKINAFDYL